MIVCGSDGDGVIAIGSGQLWEQANAWMDDHLFRVEDLVWINRISRRSFVDPSLTSCFDFLVSHQIGLGPCGI